MKRRSQVYSMAVFLLVIAATPSFAQTVSGSSTPATHISNDFSYFLKNVDSQQVVNDLRNGQWTTTVTDPNTNVTTTTTEALPTGKTGWGNVEIELALAQHSLSQQGITQPTSEELYTALTGDPATGTKGILQMRAEGMGWGEIAQQYDTKLGHLMSGIKSGKQTGTTATATSTGKGIATASGKSSTEDSLTVSGKGNGKSFAGSKSQGKGIVSASGQTVGSTSSSISHGGRGIVSGSGRALGHASGIVTGAGQGHQYGASGGSHGNGAGHGKGHSK